MPGVTWTGNDADWEQAPSDSDELLDVVERLGWADGLPVVAPTEDRVRAAVATVAIDPDYELGRMPMSNGLVTPAKVAANCVLAGCLPDSFPVVLTTVLAVLRTEFNLVAVQPTTHPVAPLAIVHGPITQKVGMNCSTGAFGPGNRANATIGRAVRLCLMNIGGTRPGSEDRATQGQPSKYSFAVAENGPSTPWRTYQAREGLADDSDAVTVFAGENPHNVNDHVNSDAPGVLGTVAAVMSNAGSNPPYLMQGEIFVILGPEHAATIAGSGFTYEDVQMWLFDHARLPLADLKKGCMWGGHAWPPWLATETDDERLIPMVATPGDVRIVVIGGPGKQSLVIPGFGMSRAVTLQIVRNQADLDAMEVAP